MKYALKNAVILDGTKDMELLHGQSVLVECEISWDWFLRAVSRWVLSRST